MCVIDGIVLQALDNSKESSPTLSASPAALTTPPGWTSTEVTVFTMLHPIYGHNYCTIAELLHTKTCWEVYQYAQLSVGDDLPGQSVGTVSKKTTIRKKQNRRCVLWMSVGWVKGEGGGGGREIYQEPRRFVYVKRATAVDLIHW